MVGFVGGVSVAGTVGTGEGHICDRDGGRVWSLAVRMRSEVKMPGGKGVEVAGDITEEEIEAIMRGAREKIEDLKGETVVVKYGGAAMSSEKLKKDVIRDVTKMRNLGVNVVLVHGGGPEVNKMLTRLGIEPVFNNGLRVTDDATMEVVEMVLAGKVNKDLVSLFSQYGGSAVGLCGKDGNAIIARQKSADLGRVGEITTVNQDLVSTLTAAGYIPVISSIALGEDSGAYNINADTLAGRLAGELNARKLVLMTDVPGVMKDPKDIKTLFSQLTVQDTLDLIDQDIISGGMIPKVRGNLAVPPFSQASPSSNLTPTFLSCFVILTLGRMLH